MTERQKRKFKRRSASTTAGVLALGVAATGIAWAAATDNMTPTENYGSAGCLQGGDSGGTVCRTDNSTWVYYYGGSSLESADRDNIRAVMNNKYEPTDLDVVRTSNPVFSGSGETDLIFQESSVPGTAEGRTWCNAPISGTQRCDQHYVDIEPGHYTKGLTCHEAGHAVGLLHGSEASPRLSKTDTRLGCMRTPIGNNSPLGTNQEQNIDATY